MPTVSIDHIAIPTANAEQLIAFYKRLGFPINNEEAWRAGTAPTFSIQVGEYSKINVHPEGFTASLRGPTAVPGCMDMGADFSRGRAGIAARIRYAFGTPNQGFQRRPSPNAMPQRQHTLR
jgi:catechol 2,3-dioxygenase-like lactoylglutathione lyase family enzyme